jgi:hypothetical protein
LLGKTKNFRSLAGVRPPFLTLGLLFSKDVYHHNLKKKRTGVWIPARDDFDTHIHTLNQFSSFYLYIQFTLILLLFCLPTLSCNIYLYIHLSFSILSSFSSYSLRVSSNCKMKIFIISMAFISWEWLYDKPKRRNKCFNSKILIFLCKWILKKPLLYIYFNRNFCPWTYPRIKVVICRQILYVLDLAKWKHHWCQKWNFLYKGYSKRIAFILTAEMKWK